MYSSNFAGAGRRAPIFREQQYGTTAELVSVHNTGSFRVFSATMAARACFRLLSGASAPRVLRLGSSLQPRRANWASWARGISSSNVPAATSTQPIQQQQEGGVQAEQQAQPQKHAKAAGGFFRGSQTRNLLWLRACSRAAAAAAATRCRHLLAAATHPSSQSRPALLPCPPAMRAKSCCVFGTR